ncbi:MAG: radical SAM protein [Candidatus Coatesbacteria bacterium]|nr:radical SAM protein [Candidatus Coatesbacteria bacterium]
MEVDVEKRLRRIEEALDHLKENDRDCKLCPRACRVNREAGERGFCRAGIRPKVFRHAAHHGEEPPISGTKGSGTVFFSHCTMRCIYCQNHRFSQLDQGRELSSAELCEVFFDLQDQGCHNINLVTPTQFMPWILEALNLAYGAGLSLPIVYNTSSYETTGLIETLEGIIDIYLADIRYADPVLAREYSNAPDYVARSREALKAMWHATGPLVLDADGIASRGLIIRHLVLPGHSENTRASLNWIAEGLSTDVAVSLMGQYRPAYKALEHQILSRRITAEEYAAAFEIAQELDFETLFIQPSEAEFPDELFGGRMQET